MGFSFIEGAPCLEVRYWTPRSSRRDTCLSPYLNWALRRCRELPRAARSRVSGFVLWGRTEHVEGAVVAGGKPVSPLAVSLIAFAVIFGGAFLGVLLRRALPGHHLDDDAKDVVRLGTGLISTIAALVLGLVIASAKSEYDTQKSQVQHLTADIILLDQLL